MKWILHVELTHKSWFEPLHKTLSFEGASLDQVLDQFKADKVRDCDLFNLRHNKATSFRDVNNVTHRWRLEEIAL